MRRCWAKPDRRNLRLSNDETMRSRVFPPNLVGLAHRLEMQRITKRFRARYGKAFLRCHTERAWFVQIHGPCGQIGRPAGSAGGPWARLGCGPPVGSARLAARGPARPRPVGSARCGPPRARLGLRPPRGLGSAAARGLGCGPWARPRPHDRAEPSQALLRAARVRTGQPRGRRQPGSAPSGHASAPSKAASADSSRPASAASTPSSSSASRTIRNTSPAG